MSPLSHAELEAAYRLHADAVYRQARVILGDADAAGDVVQVVFEKALIHSERFDGARPVLPWLLGIASHEALHAARRRRVRAWVPFTGSERSVPADASPVWEAVTHLPPAHRAVVALFYLHGYSLDETAAILGIPRGTVGSRLHKARRQLRSRLDVQREEATA
jgi:RNA polymerase sigma-70 factor (ECF subfamily)